MTELHERFGRDNDPGSMNGWMTDLPFQFLSDRQQVGDFGIFVSHFTELRDVLQGPRYRGIRTERGDHLSDPVGLEK